MKSLLGLVVMLIGSLRIVGILLQEFDVEIRDKKGVENVVADHLSRMNRGQDDKEPIEDKMRDDHLYRVLDKDTWMIDIIRAIRKMPLDHLDKKLSKEDNLRK
jgi:hypothetical protein